MRLKQLFAVVYQFLKRDALANKGVIVRHIINDNIIVPLLFALSFGYILPAVAGIQKDAGLGIFLGCIMWSILGFLFVRTLDIAFDLHGDRFIAYQASVLKPSMLIIEKIFFFSLFSFLIFIPFYPVCFLFLGYVDLLFKINWVQLLAVLFLGSYMISSLLTVEMVYVSGPDKLENFWMRFLHVFAMLGGAMMPWHGMFHITPLLARLMYINPFIYMTEGIRQAIVGGDKFFSFSVCILAMVLFSIAFSALAIYYFKKKIDHV